MVYTLIANQKEEVRFLHDLELIKLNLINLLFFLLVNKVLKFIKKFTIYLLRKTKLFNTNIIY
jgi:hypothetical protein